MKQASSVVVAWVILIIGLFHLGTAQAADLNCQHAIDNHEMGICSTKEFEKATGELAVAEARVQRFLRGSRRALAAFELDQKDWNEFLIVRCSDGYLGFNQGGSGVTPAIARGYCKADEMRKRAKRLKAFN